MTETRPRPAPALTFLEPGVVRLRYVERPSPRSWAVIATAEAGLRPAARREGDAEVLETEALRLELRGGSLRALDRQGTVLLEEGPGLGFSEAEGRRTVRRRIGAGERFYGFGEKTGPLDKRGRTMVMWNTDCFVPALEGYRPDGDPLYQSIPFFIGLRAGVAYGLFVDDPHRLTFDMGAARPDVWQVTSAGGALDQYLIAGPRVADVVRRYTWLTGRMPLPPRWALGYHQSRWGYSPDEEVREVCRTLRAKDLPCDGLWLDIQHMDGFRSFTWDPATFPRPRALLAELAAQGYKTVLIADPGLKADPAWDVYAEAVREGHLLSRDGAPFIGKVWPGDAAWPDFTRPSARAFWGRLVRNAVDDGARGVWVDMNEPANMAEGAGMTVPDDLPVHGDGVPSTMAEAHNVYGLLHARATFEGLAAAAPARRPFVLTRAGYAGIQRYAAVWTGDAPSRWDQLAQTPAMLMNLGLSGVALAGSDVGGYGGRATPEMYARWMQVGAVSPFFRTHCSRDGNRQEPWCFGPEVEATSRAAIRERYALLPYLYSLAFEASQTGAPILRPLLWEFQGDPRTHGIEDQLLLGPWLMAAPVLTPGTGARDVLLPAGRWLDLATGAVHAGGGTLRVVAPLDVCPTFLREGGIVPRCAPLAWSDARPIDRLELDCFPGPTESSFALYEDDGDSPAHARGVFSLVTFRLRREGTSIRLACGPREGTFAPAPRTLAVRLRDVAARPAAVTADGVPLPARAGAGWPEAPGWSFDAAARCVLVACGDRPGIVIETR
jgi:alpha-glucosidase